MLAETIDPVDAFVAGLAQPGGNITGFVMFETALAGKRLELLRAIKQKRENKRRGQKKRPQQFPTGLAES